MDRTARSPTPGADDGHAAGLATLAHDADPRYRPSDALLELVGGWPALDRAILDQPGTHGR